MRTSACSRRAVGATPLVPFRFGTIYRSEDGVRTMLRDARPSSRDALERLRGRVELGVKAFLVEPDARSERRRAAVERPRRTCSGSGGARDCTQRADGRARVAVRALHERLGRSPTTRARTRRSRPSSPGAARRCS